MGIFDWIYLYCISVILPDYNFKCLSVWLAGCLVTVYYHVCLIISVSL